MGSAGDNYDEGREAHETKETYYRKILLVGHVSRVNDYRTKLLFRPSTHLRAAPLVADKHKLSSSSTSWEFVLLRPFCR